MNKNDPDLPDILRALRPPAPSDEGREDALRRALQALHEPAPAPTGSNAVSWLLMGSLSTAACLLIFFFWLGMFRPQSASPISSHVLAEVEQLFPNQVTAVILDRGNMRLVLADTPAEEAPDQRIRVTFTKGNRSLDVLTYSGREVCVSLDGRQVCFTPLQSGEGDVFVETQNALFRGSDKTTIDGFEVTMQSLNGKS